MRLHFLVFSLMILILGCASDQSNQDLISQRPYDPWIVRSVLDGKPRMLTLALNDKLWVSYNTAQCAIGKAWSGHVNFEGAVFTTAHGPQPVTVGDAYFENSIAAPWSILQAENARETTAAYTGHRINNGHAELMYQLNTIGLSPMNVYEQVEYISGTSGQIGLERIFTTENIPEGYRVRLHTNINSIASAKNVDTDGEFSVVKETARPVGSMQVLDLEGQLTLNSNGKTRFVVWFIGKPTLKNPNQVGEDDNQELPLGQRLISRSDCKTCHNTNVQTIGPAYTDVAKRYPNDDATLTMLVNKVIKGGAGIWGIQVMTAHPSLSETDASEMVKYILSLDTAETNSPDATAVNITEFATAIDSVKEADLIPGVITQIFIHTKSLSQIPPMSGKPQMAGVMANFDNIDGAEFTGLTDNFALNGSGYLSIPEKGVYTFQLWSDDGSKFSLNKALLIDHDGSHGTTAKEATVGLNSGYYPFLLEFYQGAGGRFLSMNWKRPGSETWEVIPASLYYHKEEQRKALSGLSLPMSALTRIPGDQFSLNDVHPSYDLSQARPYDFLPKIGGMDFLSDGGLVISTWDPTGSIYLLRNVTAKNPGDITVKRIASGFAEPLGVKVVADEIYVLQKQELTKLVDTDGDEIADEYRVVSNQWRTSSNFHEFAFGLAYKDGFFYANLATAIDPGGASTKPQIPDRGKVMKISQKDGSVEFIAHGLRTPNGIGWGVDGELFVADNQGDWLPSSKIVHVTKDAWFGSRSVDFEGTATLKEKPPVVWLPQDEIGNSPSTPGLLQDGPYAGQMFHGEVTHGGLKRVFVEKINGEYQGAVFRFIQGLEAGVNRSVYGPDGSLYVGGIGNPGNWAQTDKLWYGLQRLKYNGKSTFEMLAVRAKSDGVEIEFTEPLREGDGWNAADFEIRQWKYVPTVNYGGPKVNDVALKVTSSHVSADHKRVFLSLNGMKSGHVVYVHLRNRFVSATGSQIWSTEAWYTMNQIPSNTPGERTTSQVTYAINALTPEEEAQGWKLLFDGKTLNGWHNFRKTTIGKSWIVDAGAITLDAKKNPDGHWQAPDGGDILTEEEYENFEFNIEWKISNCGNSGIIYNVVEGDKYDYVWNTGPEMQILDNTCHPDARFKTHRAGDLYDLIECAYVTVKPAGEWNNVRLIKNKGKVEHWLNGVKVVEYEMYTDRWLEMIANSKFKDMPDFGRATKGRISLQDHGDKVWFRNIKIKVL